MARTARAQANCDETYSNSARNRLVPAKRWNGRARATELKADERAFRRVDAYFVKSERRFRLNPKLKLFSLREDHVVSPSDFDLVPAATRRSGLTPSWPRPTSRSGWPSRPRRTPRAAHRLRATSAKFAEVKGA